MKFVSLDRNLTGRFLLAFALLIFVAGTFAVSASNDNTVLNSAEVVATPTPTPTPAPSPKNPSDPVPSPTPTPPETPVPVPSPSPVPTP